MEGIVPDPENPVCCPPMSLPKSIGALNASPALATVSLMRRNLLLHGLEGGIYMGGQAFTAADSVLPAMMGSLGAPIWVVALMPMLSTIGFSLPPLLTAHRVEGLTRMHPLVSFTGIFQRLPYLVAALSLFWVWPTHPLLAVGLAALAPLASGLVSGISYVAWQELIAKSIDTRRLSSLHAMRQLVCSAIGIGAGPLIAHILHRYPDHRGYAALHALTFLLLVVSYFIFIRIREFDLPSPGRQPHPTLGASLRSLPALWRGDPTLRSMVWIRGLHSGVLVMTPFLAMHALAVTGRPESQLGVFVTAQMAGVIGGNLLAAYVGDRFGGWMVVDISRWLLVLTCIVVMASGTTAGFVLTFLLYGAAMSINQVGMSALYLEACPVARRPTYLAVIAAVNVPSLLVAAACSTAFRNLTQSILLPASLALACVFLSFYHLHRLRRPRPGTPNGT